METIKKVIGNVTNHVSEFTSGTTSIIIDLAVFYRMGRKNNPPLFFWSHFLELLNVATEGGKITTVEINNESFSEFVDTTTLSDREAMEDLQEAIIDTTTESGRLETRKRLGVLALRIQKGELGFNEDRINIGWFKFSSGEIRRAGFGWRYNKWNFGCNDIIDNPKLDPPGTIHYWTRSM